MFLNVIILCCYILLGLPKERRWGSCGQCVMFMCSVCYCCMHLALGSDRKRRDLQGIRCLWHRTCKHTLSIVNLWLGAAVLSVCRGRMPLKQSAASTSLCYFSSPKICPREDSFFLSHCLSMKLIPSSPDGLPILADKLQTQLLSGESSLAAAVKKPKRFRRVCVVCFIIKLNVPPFFSLRLFYQKLVRGN